MSRAPDAGRTGRWRVISALGVVMIFTWGSTYYLMTVLADPIAADTGWPPALIMGAFSAGLLVAGGVSPLVGRTIAERGGRPVLATGCALIAAGLLTVAVAPALWVFWLGWAILGAGMAAGLYDPAFATLGRLYGRDARGPITALTLWGGFASTVCWPLSALMLETWGWRGVAAAYGLVHLCGTLPIVLLGIPRADPAAARAATGPASAPAPVLSRPETVAFAVFAAMLVVNGLIVMNVAIYLFTFLQHQGHSLAAAVALGTLMGPAQVAARLVEMAGRGRHHPVWTLAASTGALATGACLLAFGQNLPGLALILYGAGNGLFSIVRGALPLALFGPERYPVLMGRLARPALLAQAVGPMAGALMITHAGPGPMLDAIALLALVKLSLAAVLWLRVRAGV